jgi:hypothetical protein
MRKIFTALCASALSATFAITSIAPVAAAPVFTPRAPAMSSDIIPVEWNGGHRRTPREWRYHGRRHGHWRGHRGWRGDYRHHRRHRGWHNGAGLATGLITGAIIGGALSNGRTVYRGGGNSHVQWCYDRYRSYRASDNTFQPYNGPRQQCYSPY